MKTVCSVCGIIGLIYCLNAQAAVVTFENRVVDRLDLLGLQHEGNIQYQAHGEGWELNDYRRTGDSFIATRFNGENPVLGDKVDFSYSSGSLFRFIRIDYEASPFNDTDIVTVKGFFGSLLVGSAVIDGESPDRDIFLTEFSSFSSPLDRLSIEVTYVGQGGGIKLDNIILENITAVPLPASGVLFLSGISFFVLFRRKYN